MEKDGHNITTTSKAQLEIHVRLDFVQLLSAEKDQKKKKKKGTKKMSAEVRKKIIYLHIQTYSIQMMPNHRNTVSPHCGNSSMRWKNIK